MFTLLKKNRTEEYLSFRHRTILRSGGRGLGEVRENLGKEDQNNCERRTSVVVLHVSQREIRWLGRKVSF